MNETLVTVVGNVATKPEVRAAANGAMLRFRLASSSRYYDRVTQGWKDGHTNFLTVFAWRSLAENAASSLSLGDPVVVQGRLKVRQQSEGAGSQGVIGVDLEAVALGHDLSRGTAAFRRVSRANPGLSGGAGGPGGPGGAGSAGSADGPGGSGDSGGSGGSGGSGEAAGAADRQAEREPVGEGPGVRQGVASGLLPEREPEPAF